MIENYKGRFSSDHVNKLQSQLDEKRSKFSSKNNARVE